MVIKNKTSIVFSDTPPIIKNNNNMLVAAKTRDNNDIPKFNRTRTLLTTGALVAILSASVGFIALSASVHADNADVVDKVNISIPTSCSMTGTGMNSHNDEIANGIYRDNIGTTTLKAFCNDNGGFAIYATGFTGDEIGGENSNKLVGATTGTGNIISGIATGPNGNDDISNWAMKLTKLTDSGDTTTNPFTIDSAANIDNPSQAESGATLVPFSDYHVVPNEYTKVAHKDSSTDMNETTGGVSLTTTYAAYISKTQPADTYRGKVKYTLVHPATAEPSTSNCESGHICYDANADSSEIEGAMDAQALVKAKDWSSCEYTDNATYCVGPEPDYSGIDINTLPELDSYMDPTLQASNFKRAGYGFAGWNDKADMSGTNYGPIQSISVSSDKAEQGITLYAYWVESVGNLQGWNGCNTLNANQVIGLTDTRDNNVYAVAKLADGNCWMIENLRLADKDSNNNPIALNSTNTNNPASTFTALSATSNDWCTQYNSEACVNQNKLNTNNTISFVTNATGVQDGDIYSYGNYYNWYTATAGTGTYSQNSGNAAGDICPNGWSLPTGNVGGQFSALDVSMGGTGNGRYTKESSNKWRSYPNNFLYSGMFGAFSSDHRGEYGYYWTSTVNNNSTSYYLYLEDFDMQPGTYYGFKNYGFSVRCVVSS